MLSAGIVQIKASPLLLKVSDYLTSLFELLAHIQYYMFIIQIITKLNKYKIFNLKFKKRKAMYKRRFKLYKESQL